MGGEKGSRGFFGLVGGGCPAKSEGKKWLFGAVYLGGAKAKTKKTLG